MTGTRAMESYSTLDRSAPEAGILPGGEASVGSNPERGIEQKVEQRNGTRTSQASISAAVAVATAGVHSTLAPSMRFPGEDGGRSLAEMAQHDLDAALQLLADRAQYITGANGAAIALRRDGKNDMQCRASTGANVPELGALLSTEFGLSGESVRTRQPLRCDDAERDPRVNREGCRQLGIASVVVMPVVNDDEVLGVFELFSGKVNAFGERDLSALQRLSEMVETAVRLARAAESVAEPSIAAVSAAEGAASPDVPDENVLDDDILGQETLVAQNPVLELEAEPLADAGSGDPEAEAFVEKESSGAALEGLRHPGADFSAGAGLGGDSEALPEPSIAARAPAAEPPVLVQSVVPPPIAPLREERAPLPAVQTALPKKPLFWSAALSPEAEKPAEADRSHVPPVLRNLRTCEACGFPVSPGRALCVECEEKRWRGQLKRPVAPLQSASPASEPKAPPFDSLRAGVLPKNARNGAPGLADSPSAPVARLVAAAAASAAAGGPARQSVSAAEVSMPAAQAALPDSRVNESKEVAGKQVVVALNPAVLETASVAPLETSEAPSPGFVLSAGLEPSQSWLSANKYIVGAILVVAATVVAIVLLR